MFSALQRSAATLSRTATLTTRQAFRPEISAAVLRNALLPLPVTPGPFTTLGAVRWKQTKTSSYHRPPRASPTGQPMTKKGSHWCQSSLGRICGSWSSHLQATKVHCQESLCLSKTTLQALSRGKCQGHEEYIPSSCCQRACKDDTRFQERSLDNERACGTTRGVVAG